MVLFSVCFGISDVIEIVFENCMCYVLELNRMGVNIRVKGNYVIVKGVFKLFVVLIIGIDFRVFVVLILVVLVVEGEIIF